MYHLIIELWKQLVHKCIIFVPSWHDTRDVWWLNIFSQKNWCKIVHWLYRWHCHTSSPCWGCTACCRSHCTSCPARSRTSRCCSPRRSHQWQLYTLHHQQCYIHLHTLSYIWVQLNTITTLNQTFLWYLIVSFQKLIEDHQYKIPPPLIPWLIVFFYSYWTRTMLSVFVVYKSHCIRYKHGNWSFYDALWNCLKR